MAQVTVELGRLLNETNFTLFDFPYTFDDISFKSQLEKDIIEFFYDYEIGQETPDMFKRKFKARWNRIMPYYNKLYNTTLLTYNPLTNYSVAEALDQLAKSNTTQTTDMTTKNTGNVTMASEDNSTSDSNSQVSDYPQQPIAGGDFLAGENSSVTTTDGSTNSTTTNNLTNETDGTVTNNGTNETNYSKTIEGITGTSYPDLIQKHRDALMRINDMIINEMKPCFILVY